MARIPPCAEIRMVRRMASLSKPNPIPWPCPDPRKTHRNPATPAAGALAAFRTRKLQNTISIDVMLKPNAFVFSQMRLGIEDLPGHEVRTDFVALRQGPDRLLDTFGLAQCLRRPGAG